METNTIPVGDYGKVVDGFLTQLSSLSDKLIGAPVGALVIIGLVILRIIWTRSPLSNNHLYWLMPLIGIGTFMWLAPYREGHLRVDSGRNFMLGLIFTGISFFIYRAMMKIPKIKALIVGDEGNTQIIKKIDVEPPTV